jgi:hypothetical protein
MCVTYLGDINIREHNLHANVNKMHIQHTVIHITQYTVMYIMIQVNREECRLQTCMIWGTDENWDIISADRLYRDVCILVKNHQICNKICTSHICSDLNLEIWNYLTNTHYYIMHSPLLHLTLRTLQNVVFTRT